METTRALMPRARQDELVVEELQDETLVYDLERHKARCLNRTAALVWRCIAMVKRAWPRWPRCSRSNWPSRPTRPWCGWRWIAWSGAHLLTEPVTLPADRAQYSRRQMLRTLRRAAGISLLLPVIESIVAPLAVAQGSCVTSLALCGTFPPNCMRRAPLICGKLCCNGSCLPAGQAKGQSCVVPNPELLNESSGFNTCSEVVATGPQFGNGQRPGTARQAGSIGALAGAWRASPPPLRPRLSLPPPSSRSHRCCLALERQAWGGGGCGRPSYATLPLPTNLSRRTACTLWRLAARSAKSSRRSRYFGQRVWIRSWSRAGRSLDCTPNVGYGPMETSICVFGRKSMRPRWLRLPPRGPSRAQSIGTRVCHSSTALRWMMSTSVLNWYGWAMSMCGYWGPKIISATCAYTCCDMARTAPCGCATSPSCWSLYRRILTGSIWCGETGGPRIGWHPRCVWPISFSEPAWTAFPMVERTRQLPRWLLPSVLNQWSIGGALSWTLGR